MDCKLRNASLNNSNLGFLFVLFLNLHHSYNFGRGSKSGPEFGYGRLVDYGPETSESREGLTRPGDLPCFSWKYCKSRILQINGVGSLRGTSKTQHTHTHTVRGPPFWAAFEFGGGGCKKLTTPHTH